MSNRTNVTDPEQLAREFLFAHCIWDPSEDFSPDDDLHPALQQHVHRNAFERGDFTLRYWRGEFYGWDTGRYLKVSDAEMKCRITNFLHGFNRPSFVCSGSDRYVTIKTELVKNILLCLAGTEGVHIPEQRLLNSWEDGREEKLGIQTIVFNNGLMMLDETDERPTFRSHTPRYFTPVRLPYDYDQHADCPRWRRFLDDVMDADRQRIELLCQWAGYLLTPDCRRHKFMLIAGEGQNGKTVFATLLERMLGVDNVTHVPLSQFGRPFALASTLGKMLNSTSESCHGLDEFAETMLKSYTSGDRMTFDRKYKEPVHAVPTAKIMISTNQLPQFADKSQGLWRRLLFVLFEKSIPEHRQNPLLIDELSAELPGIFNWAYQGLLRLRKAGRFIMPEKCRRAIEQYRRDVNPARAFLLDNYVCSLEFEGLPCREVYDSYVRWCHENGYRPLNSSNFGKEVKELSRILEPLKVVTEDDELIIIKVLPFRKARKWLLNQAKVVMRVRSGSRDFQK